MKKSLFTLLLLLISLSVISQKARVKQADKQFALHNFNKAALLWQKAFHNTSDENDRKMLAFRIGSALHRMNRFEDAIQWYTDALGDEAAKPEWLLAKADALLRAGKAEDAKLTAERVLIIQPYSAEAKKIIALVDAYEKSKINEPLIQLIPAKSINTMWSDYAAAWLNDDLVVSSTRTAPNNQKVDGRTAEYFSGLYLFIANLYGDFGEAIPLSVKENSNVGTFSFDQRHNRIFFTQCSNRKQRCMIMQASFDARNFEVGKAKPAAFINRKYHYGHPFVNESGSTLYFSARLPGGYGGNDIYSISLKPDGTFGLPINLGPSVNTAFDEVFPGMAGDSILFFSSNGHAGFGGLDIYYSMHQNGFFDKPLALLPPFNSTSDDFSLHMRQGTTRGVLSSSRNREGGDDIYFFDAFPIQHLIRGQVRDAQTDVLIADAEVRVYDDEPAIKTTTDKHGTFLISVPKSGSLKLQASHKAYQAELKTVKHEDNEAETIVHFRLNRKSHPVKLMGKVTERETKQLVSGQIVSITGPGGYLSMTRTSDDGIYQFDSLNADRIYTVSVEKEGYFAESRVIRIPEVNKATTFHKATGYDLDFELTQIVIKKEITLNNIYYDFDKASLRESSKTELLKLVSMMRSTPQVRIKISAHTDTRGTNTYNDRLSAERAQSVVDFLVQSGINPMRLEAQGYGKRFPVIAHAKTEDEHQANRRTTFQVLDLNAPQEITTIAPESINSGLSFRVQLLVSSTSRDSEESFGALRQLLGEIQFFESYADGVYRYEAGTRYSLPAAEALRNGIRAAGFSDAFVVPYINQQRVSLQQARDYKP